MMILVTNSPSVTNLALQPRHAETATSTASTPKSFSAVRITGVALPNEMFSSAVAGSSLIATKVRITLTSLSPSFIMMLRVKQDTLSMVALTTSALAFATVSVLVAGTFFLSIVVVIWIADE